jgi:hypothetical protein
MALCGSTSCGCAITSNSLTITGNGTAGNPYDIELASVANIVSDYSFLDAAERNAYLSSPTEGTTATLRSLNQVTRWNGSAWRVVFQERTAYTPTVNFGIGNATLDFYYSRSGEIVFLKGRCTIGNSSTFPAGLFTPSFTLPVAAYSGSWGSRDGAPIVLYDVATTRLFPGFAEVNGSTLQVYNMGSGSGNYQINGAGAPFSWGVGDEFWINIWYHAA